MAPDRATRDEGVVVLEHRSRPVLSRARFLVRLARYMLISAGLVLASLLAGAIGYHELEGMAWLDAVYAATMILTGMGPVAELKHDATKVFATVYALFSGVVFVSAAALLITPIAHRVLHILHCDAPRR